MDSTTLAAWIAAGASIIGIGYQFFTNLSLETLKAELTTESNKEHYRFTKYHETQVEALTKTAIMIYKAYEAFSQINHLLKYNDFDGARVASVKFQSVIEESKGYSPYSILFLDDHLIQQVGKLTSYYLDYNIRSMVVIVEKRQGREIFKLDNGTNLPELISAEHVIVYQALRNKIKELLSVRA